MPVVQLLTINILKRIHRIGVNLTSLTIFIVEDEKDKKEEMVPEKVLAIIEEAYPNSLTIDDMSRRFKAETEVVRNMVLELVNKKLVKPVGVGVPGAAGLDSAAGAFRRVHQNEEEVTIVKQMPRGVDGAHQPTIAVISAQYFEKMAVDAMMTNNQTFMRYATVGEGKLISYFFRLKKVHTDAHKIIERPHSINM